MGLEFERKFIFKNEKDAAKLLEKHSTQDKVSKIEQSYLIPDCAKLIFNETACQWDININLKDNQQMAFSAPVEQADIADIKSIIAKSNSDNLLDIPKMSSRVRFKPNVTLFTAKFKPFYEFEPAITLPEGMKQILLSNLPSVTKLRHEITINGYNLELDIFNDNQSVPILELEYETEQKMLDFNPSDLGLDLIEVTPDNYYRNIYIAKRNFNK